MPMEPKSSFQDAIERPLKRSRQLGHDVLAVPTDVTKLSEIDQLMARAHETFGKLDILFVNAGIFKGAPLEAGVVRMRGQKLWCSPKRLC